MVLQEHTEDPDLVRTRGHDLRPKGDLRVKHAWG